MEDYLTFVDVYAPFVFFNLPWMRKDHVIRDMFNRQWSALRAATLCCLRQPQKKDLQEHVQEYRSAIWDYAAAAHEVRSMTFINLKPAAISSMTIPIKLDACINSPF